MLWDVWVRSGGRRISYFAIPYHKESEEMGNADFQEYKDSIRADSHLNTVEAPNRREACKIAVKHARDAGYLPTNK